MQFLFPSFLWALLALAIPIIIHLFHFRRFKKVYFSNVRFLKEIKEETANRNKLKHLLVLCARLLSLAFLVFAFAQPFIPQNKAVKQGEKAVSIFIDNSFSMSALSSDVPLIEKAKQRAREIVIAYKDEDRFQILTNDFEGKHQRLVSKEEALAFIEEIGIKPAVRTLDKVISRQKQTLKSSTIEQKVIFIISDFQKNITNLRPEADSLFDLNLVPLQSVQQANISIDSAWFEAPAQMLNQANRLMVKVKNYSQQEAENVRLSLYHNGQNKPIGTVNLSAGAEVVDTVAVGITKTGWQEAFLQITDHPIQFDDIYYFSFNVPQRINVLVINESINATNPYLAAAFKTSPSFVALQQNINNLDYASFQKNQLIILNDVTNISSGLTSELAQYVKKGGNVLVFPSAQSNIDSYNTFLQNFSANKLGNFERTAREIAQINTEEFIFNDVYEKNYSNLKLPSTKGNFKMQGAQGEEVLLSYRDGQTFLGKYRVEEGHLYLCAAPLNEAESNLARNAEVFVPMLFKMALSSGRERKIAHTIGQDELLQTANAFTGVGAESNYKMKGKVEEFIPSQKTLGGSVLLDVNDQVTEAGYFDLYLKQGETLEKYAFNYDRKESDLNYYAAEALQKLAGEKANIMAASNQADLSQLVGERDRGIVLWKWCLVFVLVFLLLEMLLLRFWK